MNARKLVKHKKGSTISRRVIGKKIYVVVNPEQITPILNRFVLKCQLLLNIKALMNTKCWSFPSYFCVKSISLKYIYL